MKHPLLRWALMVAVLALSACANQKMPGYQNVYQGYSVPAPLLEKIAVKFREYGLTSAGVARDNVGRIRLTGSYRDEDEVEKAYVIVQSIVGLKSTSPFYPEDVKEKRWERDAARAMAEFSRVQATRPPPAVKRALVIGINRFIDNQHLRDIQGEDDATVVRDALKRSGYTVTSLLGSQATKARIESALEQMEREVGADDTLFIYVSSHGNPPSPSPQGRDERRMSIAAYDSGDINGAHRGNQTDYLVNLQRTSVKDTLIQRVAQRPTRVTRVLIDTCYSGEILKGIPDESQGFILRTNGGQVEREGVSLAAWSGPRYTAKGIRFTADAAPANDKTQSGAQKPPSVSVDKSRAGYAIITATSEGQESLGPPAAIGVFPSPVTPGKMLKGSFFTQALFAFLEVHQGQVDPAFDDAKRFTERKALEVSGGERRQVPRQFTTVPTSTNNLFQ